MGQLGHLRQAVAAKTRHVLPSLGSWVSAGQDYWLCGWQRLGMNCFGGRSPGVERLHKVLLDSGGPAQVGSFIQIPRRPPRQRNMLTSDVSPPFPQSTLPPGFFLACMYPCENPSLSSLFCCLTPSGSLQPCCSLSGDDPYTLVDCFGWGRMVHPGKLPSCGWCHNSSCWICKLPLYSTDPLSLSSQACNSGLILFCPLSNYT